MDEDMSGQLATAQRLAQSAYSNSEHALIKIEGMENLNAEKDKRISGEFKSVFTAMNKIQLDIEGLEIKQDKNWEEQRKLIASTGGWVVAGLITVIAILVYGMIKP